MRLDADITDEDRQRVKAYADDKGVRMRRAYADLLRSALDAKGY